MNGRPERNHETYFFRHLEQLNQVVGFLTDGSRSTAGSPQRVWSAGCSLGAEPFSLAILLDRRRRHPTEFPVRLLGTDCSAEVLEQARAGRFLPWYLRHCPEGIRERYFGWNGTHALLSPNILTQVEFCLHDLESGSRMGGRFDGILCRNVLMYFERPRQKKILRLLADQLREGGFLAVGIAETVCVADHPDLSPVAGGLALFRKQRSVSVLTPPVRPARPLPMARSLAPVPVSIPQTEKQALRELQEATRLAEQDQPELARAALKRCLYLAPRLSAAHLQLGLLERSQGRAKQAERSFRNALHLAQRAPAEQPAEGFEQWTNGQVAALASRMLNLV